MIDDFCKQLVARHPASVGRWLLSIIGPASEQPAALQQAPDRPAAPQPDAHQGPWQLLDRELSREALRADSVVLMPAEQSAAAVPILHLEFQTRPDAAIPERMLEYWILLHRRFRRPIRQVVIHLRPTASPLAHLEELAIHLTRHRFTSLRLWEQEPGPLLSDSALLPLAVLTRHPDGPPERVLSQVRRRLLAIPDPDQRRLITSGCQLLAGLTFPQDVIQRLLAMSILEDSSVYQYIVRKGLAEGRELGLQQGLLEGRQEGRREGRQEGRREGRQEGLQEGLEVGRQQEAVNLLLRQLERRCGPLDRQQRDAIAALSLERLEDLGEAVLDFQGPGDLTAWLSGPATWPS